MWTYTSLSCKITCIILWQHMKHVIHPYYHIPPTKSVDNIQSWWGVHKDSSAHHANALQTDWVKEKKHKKSNKCSVHPSWIRKMQGSFCLCLRLKDKLAHKLSQDHPHMHVQKFKLIIQEAISSHPIRNLSSGGYCAIKGREYSAIKAN